MSNYGNMLKQMSSERSLADTIMDAFVKEFVRDIFDDSIDPETRFQQQLASSERNAITTAESQQTKSLGIAIDSYEGEMNKIFSDFEKDTKYVNLKEYDKDGNAVEFKEGEKGFGLKNYTLMMTDIEKAQKKAIKNRYGMFQGMQLDEKTLGPDGKPMVGNVMYKSVDADGNIVNKGHQSVAVATMANQAVKKSENMLAQSLTRKAQLYNLRGSRQTYNQMKPEEYNQENLKTLDEIIRNMETNIEAAGEDGTRTISAEWSNLKNEVQNHRQTLSKILAHDDDEKKVGLQVKKVIKDQQIPMLFSKEDLESEVHKTRMNNSDLKNVFGQENVSMDDAAKAVDKMVKAKDYKGAMYILDKMIPSKDTKQAMFKMISANQTKMDKEWVQSDNKQREDLETFGEVLISKSQHFLNQNTVTRTDDGGWFAAPKPVEDKEGVKFTGDPSFSRGIANIVSLASPGAKFSTTSDARLHDEIGDKNTEIGKELIRMAAVGVMGSENISNTGWFEATLKKDGAKVRIGTQAYKNNPQNKGEQIVDINSLSADQVNWIINNQMPNSNGDINTLLNADAMDNGLQLFKFGSREASAGHKNSDITSFGGTNADLAFQEHKAFQEGLNFYLEQNKALNGSLAYADKAFKYQEQVKNLYNAPKVNSNGEFVYKDLDAKTLSSPLDSSIASMDEVLAGIAAVESNADPDSVNTNKDGTLDVSQYQVNSNWYRADGKFAKRADGSNDPLYMKIQELGRKHHPKWDTMTNEQRDKAFQGEANEQFAKEVASSIYQTKGAYEWTTVKNGRFQEYMDDKEGFEYKKEDNTDETEVDPKNNQTPPPVVQPGGNRFEKVEEVDLSASAAPNFSGLNLTDQSREVLNILDQLNELETGNEALFSRIELLNQLESIDKNEDYEGTGAKSIRHLALEDATKVEHAIATKIYDMAKHLNMDVPWNLGDSYDAGYEIYRDLKTHGKDSKYHNSGLTDLMVSMEQAQTETSKAIAPMMQFANRSANVKNSRMTLDEGDFIDRGMGGKKGFREVDRVIANQKLSEKDQAFMSGKERLTADIENLKAELSHSDPVKRNHWYEEGRNMRKTFAKLNQDYQREFSELESMTMGNTRESALAVLKALTDEGQVLADQQGSLSLIDNI